jgi:hypothetical protein
VSGEPTPAELQSLFEKGQSRDPNPGEAEPGFHQPLRIAFDYVKVDFKPFLEAAKKKVTEEQIETQYKKDIEQGLHKQQLELPPASDKPAESPLKARSQPKAKRKAKNQLRVRSRLKATRRKAMQPSKPGREAGRNQASPKSPRRQASGRQARGEATGKEGDSSGGCQDPPAAENPKTKASRKAR